MRELSLFVFAISFLIMNGTLAQNKLIIGRKLNITQITSLNNTSEMMGTNMTTFLYDTVNFVVEIKSSIDSTINLSSTLKRVKGTLNGMGQEMSFDSNDPTTTSNPLIANVLKDINKPQYFTLMNGKVKKDANTKSNIPEELTANGIVTSNEALIVDLFVPTTVKGKTKGYQWTADQESGDGNQKAITIFTIDDATNSAVVISSNTSLSSKGNTKMMGYDVKQNLTGTRTTTQNFDILSGILSSSTQTIIMKGTAEVMSMNLPINTKSETKTIVE